MKFARRLKAIILNILSKLIAKSKKYKVIEAPRCKGSLNIIYILHTRKKNKSGGDKVIYKQSETINNLSNSGVRSSVLHFEDTSIQFDWFEHKVNLKKDLGIDPNNDFVVIPEIMILSHAKLLHNIDVNYAIFVQNGYLIEGYSNRYDELAFAYRNASIILAISEDAVKCIITAYPWAANKIIRVFCSIDSKRFKSSDAKENLITYMPRKLARHSSLVKFFLNENLPETWKLKEIDGLNESDVIELLGKSKIFLSFSDLEGLGLPPIEAALCGNYVVGYTGEAGKEYWNSPIFTEIKCGDIIKFTENVIAKIEELEEMNLSGANTGFDLARDELAKKYSEAVEKESLMIFLNNVELVLNNKNSKLYSGN